MGTPPRTTKSLASCLLASVFLILPAGSQPLSALTGQQFNGLPSPIPSFVYYRDPQPQTPQVPLFSPINVPYRQYVIRDNLKDALRPNPYPGSVKLNVISSRFAPQKHPAYDVREDGRFSVLNYNNNDNRFAISPLYGGSLIPSINGVVLQRSSGSAAKDFGSSGAILQSFARSRPQNQQQSVVLLRYANRFPQPVNQRDDDLRTALSSLDPTLQQRQRSAASAGELLYRQQKAGAKPFLSSDAVGVQREGGEDLSSPGGFLGQPHRLPTFVSAVGTPVSGVGQNPLYTGDSVQASKLDEASDVRGVKNPGGIPAPGRLPVRQDAYFARPFFGYANNFGYSLQEDPVFNSLAPTLAVGHGPFILPPEAYQRGVINR